MLLWEHLIASCISTDPWEFTPLTSRPSHHCTQGTLQWEGFTCAFLFYGVIILQASEAKLCSRVSCRSRERHCWRYQPSWWPLSGTPCWTEQLQGHQRLILRLWVTGLRTKHDPAESPFCTLQGISTSWTQEGSCFTDRLILSWLFYTLI